MAEPSKNNPIRETNDEARALARKLMDEAVFASMAVLEPGTGIPLVSRIGVGMDTDGSPFFLASELSGHSKAVLSDPVCSIMFGEPPAKGDPLAFPRVTVIGSITKLKRDATHEARRSGYLEKHPKAALYIDFADFHFFKMQVERAALNGGFGKAFQLTADDLVLKAKA